MVAHGCRKRKKLICGTEGELVVAHGRLPSSARLAHTVLLILHRGARCTLHEAREWWGVGHTHVKKFKMFKVAQRA